MVITKILFAFFKTLKLILLVMFMYSVDIFIVELYIWSASSFPLILMYAGILHRKISFHWLWSSAFMPYIWFNIGWFSLLFSMASIKLGESVYITYLLSSLFCISLIAVIWWMLLLVVLLFWLSANTAAKPTFLLVLFDPSV